MRIFTRMSTTISTTVLCLDHLQFLGCREDKGFSETFIVCKMKKNEESTSCDDRTLGRIKQIVQTHLHT